MENPPKKTRGKNKPKKQTKPELIAQYALARAKGETKKRTAEKLGISRRQAYHLENSAPDLLKELIEQAGDKLARDGLEKATHVIIDTLDETLAQGITGYTTKETNEGDTITYYDKERHKNQLTLRKLGIQASEQVLKGTGILSTPTASPVIGSLTVQQTNVLLPAVRQIIQAVSKSAIEAPKSENDTPISD